MKQKIIVGFVGDEGVGKTTASNVLSKEGFYKVSLMAKVEEVAKYLFTSEELAADGSILKEVKRRGNATYSGYWINLALMSIPEKKDLIVIDGLEDIDTQACPIIKIVEIVKSDEDTPMYKGLKVVNDVGKKEFKEKIKTLIKTLSKK